MRARNRQRWILAGLLGLSTSIFAQVRGEPGVFEIDNVLVQISVAEEGVDFVGLPGGAGKLERKLELLAVRIDQHLAATEAQEERHFSDYERLNRGANYARKLVAKVELLVGRIEHLGEKTELIATLELAAAAFDVPLIKSSLQGKLVADDDEVAEAAFQLAGFQELDGEYQDAWANYQKASNLEPENQLYMDAHGKNEF
jgi:tetratricopeptide (TPR) repeat protein